MAYMEGKVNYWDNVDPDRMSIPVLWKLMKQVGYINYDDVYYLLSGKTLQDGLMPLRTDAQCLAMLEAVIGHDELHIYVAHIISEPELIEEVGPAEALEFGRFNEGTHDHGEVLGHEAVNADDEKSSSDEDNSYNCPMGDSSDDDDDELFAKFVDFIPEQPTKNQPCEGTSSQFNSTAAEDKEEEHFDYESEEVYSVYDSSDDEGKRRRCNNLNFPHFNTEAGYGGVKFEVGMVFPNLDVFKDAVKNYAVFEGRAVKLPKNDTKRCRATCTPPCKWVLLCSWSSDIESFQIKTFNDVHTCPRVSRNPQATSKWLAGQLLQFLRQVTNPFMADIDSHLKTAYNLTVSRAKAYRAWERAQKLMEGNERDQYAMLCNYLEELRMQNKGTTIQLGVDRMSLANPPKFDRLYICLKALKEGFGAGCRPLIGLDGCHLKGYYGGILLSAIAQDGNNAFFPIAVAVVDAENKETWRWFLVRLMEDLQEYTTNRISFMSDMQKGLIPAVAELVPGAEHRFCCRHIYTNFAKKYKGCELRDLFWNCAKATTMPEFRTRMERLKAVNDKAWEYLAAINPSAWSRAGFATHTKSQAITNNMCEQFNSKILKCRGKPIITMLEEIRLYIMEKFSKQRKFYHKYSGPLCPKPQDKLESAKKASGKWTPSWMGDPEESVFEVECKPDKYVVNLKDGTCSCRVWDLTGIPCPHVVSTLYWKNCAPEDYVHPYMRKEAAVRAYTPLIKPLNGPKLWPTSEREPILPPTIKRPPGRPKTQRKKNDVEKELKTIDPTKMKRRVIPTCSKCKRKGHNKRSCKGEPTRVAVQKTQHGAALHHQVPQTTTTPGFTGVPSTSQHQGKKTMVNAGLWTTYDAFHESSANCTPPAQKWNPMQPCAVGTNVPTSQESVRSSVTATSPTGTQFTPDQV